MFIVDTEQSAVELIFTNAIDSLSKDDQNLPQVQTILPIIKRGIGIHHGGLLPILKEIVEILFSEGFIKVCFYNIIEKYSVGIFLYNVIYFCFANNIKLGQLIQIYIFFGFCY